jgi:hypothetical protein
MDIGIYGMGRMGFNMTRRLVDKGGHRVIAGNRSSGKVDEAVEQGAEGAYSVQEFVEMQESPRVLWTMLPAGDITDEMIHQFMDLADEGDIIVDGANSYFRDSVARAREVRNAGFKWLDAGVSGGVWGYDIGYCTMIGGDADAFERAEPAFETLAPPNGYAFLGDAGAGHFAKMVHNGVEYGMLQGPLQPVEPGQRRAQLAARAGRERLRERRQPGQHPGLRRRLRRGTLDRPGSHTRVRAGQRHSRLPLRPLPVPPGRLLRHEGHSRLTRRVRRTRDQGSRNRAREVELSGFRLQASGYR